MTGTARSAAQTTPTACAGRVEETGIQPIDGWDAGAFAEDALYLMYSSTRGCRDAPDRARALDESLDNPLPYLAHARHGAPAPGDRTDLKTFACGGTKFDERLRALRAPRTGEVWCHDAGAATMPEEVDIAWRRDGLAQALGPLGAAARRHPLP